MESTVLSPGGSASVFGTGSWASCGDIVPSGPSLEPRIIAASGSLAGATSFNSGWKPAHPGADGDEHFTGIQFITAGQGDAEAHQLFVYKRARDLVAPNSGYHLHALYPLEVVQAAAAGGPSELELHAASDASERRGECHGATIRGPEVPGVHD
jgi:hypothetical protein